MRIARVVRDIDPDAATAWWSDFREGHGDHGFIPGHERRILSRGADSVVMEDETKLLGLRLFLERTTVWPDKREVRFAGRNSFGLFDGSYTFEPKGNGTRIVLDATVTLSPSLQWADVAAKPLVLTILRVDLARHAKDMRSDLLAGEQVARPRRA